MVLQQVVFNSALAAKRSGAWPDRRITIGGKQGFQEPSTGLRAAAALASSARQLHAQVFRWLTLPWLSPITPRRLLRNISSTPSAGRLDLDRIGRHLLARAAVDQMDFPRSQPEQIAGAVDGRVARRR
jgi:hypothetical protein